MSEQLISTPCTFGENDNFLLERELGTGGMGGVYMGRDKMLDRPIAVKVMLKELGNDADFVNKFKHEAQSVAKLIHPNIAQVYSYGICNGMPYIAMELAAGGSLYSIMNANPGKVDITRVLKICQQVAQALQCASDQGFVHGDVKPENILLDSNGNAKLVDFGLAAMQKDTSEIWGTPYYISPEKVKKEPVDFRADMYSLGGTLYHALTGVAPFEGEDSIAVVKKRFEGMPKKPSEIRDEITPEIDSLVMQMLAFDKNDRFPSFESLLDAFNKVLTTGLTSKTVRKTTLKRKISINKSAFASAAQKDDSKKPINNEVENLDEEEKENLGKKVALYVGLGIVVIGAIIGSLVWYQVSTANANEQQKLNQIEKAYNNAYISTTNTIENIKHFKQDIEDAANLAQTEYLNIETEIKKVMPNLDGESTVATTMKDLYDRSNSCKTCIVEIVTKLTTIHEKADSELKLVSSKQGRNEENAKAMADRVNGLSEELSALKQCEAAKTIRKNAKYIQDKGAKTIDTAVKQVKLAQLKIEREAEAVKRAAEEKARIAKQEEEKQARIAEETNDARAKFNALAQNGAFRQLDWKRAINQLESLKQEFKTEAGKLAVDLEIRKVNNMKKVQDIIISNLKAYTFKKVPFKGCKVLSVNDTEIVLQMPDGRKSNLSWMNFYRKENENKAGNINILMNDLIVNARQVTSMHKLNLRDWSDAMTGAVLTMKLVFPDVPGAAEYADELAKRIVKEYPEFLKTAKGMFPEINFDDVKSEE